MARARIPAPGTVLDERYEVLSVLGEGATGVVVRARVRAGGPDIALKLIDAELFQSDDARRRFEREARALVELDHPNVIRVLRTGMIDGRAFLATELQDGETLERSLRRGAPSPEVATAIATQLLEGLAFVHDHGLVHRDLKPGNVFLARGKGGAVVPKLLDFGLVKFGEDSNWGPASILTAAGTMLGTPGYMAPEQAFGGTIDARVDVYAAGAVAYELFAGHPPFVGEDPPSLLRAHALEPVPPLSRWRPRLSARPELDAWLRRALDKSPPARFGDAREMRLALLAIPAPVAWLTPS